MARLSHEYSATNRTRPKNFEIKAFIYGIYDPNPDCQKLECNGQLCLAFHLISDLVQDRASMNSASRYGYAPALDTHDTIPGDNTGPLGCAGRWHLVALRRCQSERRSHQDFDDSAHKPDCITDGATYGYMEVDVSAPCPSTAHAVQQNLVKSTACCWCYASRLLLRSAASPIINHEPLILVPTFISAPPSFTCHPASLPCSQCLLQLIA